MGRAKAKPISTVARPPWKPTSETPVQRIEHQGFLLLLTAVTLAFAWVLYPFYGAVLWAVVVAVLFAPVHRRLLQSMQGQTEPRGRGSPF
jgi:predicted PurR-regulated permease PerM